MLFNSQEFLFAFLPLTLLAFLIGQRIGGNAALIALGVASFFFYGWWDASALPILLSSIAINWVAGEAITKLAQQNNNPASKRVLQIGISINLAILIYYKYSGFLYMEVIHKLFTATPDFTPPTLPIGVSFFTFTQIAYLVDSYIGKAKKFSPLHYALFVNYFPHLIAGPILHHADMMPQFEAVKSKTEFKRDFQIGGAIFLVGLAKKLLIADPLGLFVNSFYAGLGSAHVQPGFFECLLTALGYSLQLYFDFSGYSDMAIGISRLFGVDLPLNFNSPYKSANIIDFWRRWHISLSTFLRDYLYIPLGGGRKGTFRRFLNLFTTMLLGGLWHGAGWTFLLWGGIHGTLLIINHGIRALIPSKTLGENRVWIVLSTTATFIAVTLAWIPFRAPDMASTTVVLKGLLGLNGATLPAQVLAVAPFLNKFADSVGNVPLLADGTVMGFIEYLIIIVIGLFASFFTPNTQELSHKARLTIGTLALPLILQKILFGGKVEFLYFQF